MCCRGVRAARKRGAGIEVVQRGVQIDKPPPPLPPGNKTETHRRSGLVSTRDFTRWELAGVGLVLGSR